MDAERQPRPSPLLLAVTLPLIVAIVYFGTAGFAMGMGFRLLGMGWWDVARTVYSPVGVAMHLCHPYARLVGVTYEWMFPGQTAIPIMPVGPGYWLYAL